MRIEGGKCNFVVEEIMYESDVYAPRGILYFLGSFEKSLDTYRTCRSRPTFKHEINLVSEKSHLVPFFGWILETKNALN